MDKELRGAGGTACGGEVLVKCDLLLLCQLTNACLEHFWVGL